MAQRPDLPSVPRLHAGLAIAERASRGQAGGAKTANLRCFLKTSCLAHRKAVYSTRGSDAGVAQQRLFSFPVLVGFGVVFAFFIKRSWALLPRSPSGRQPGDRRSAADPCGHQLGARDERHRGLLPRALLPVRGHRQQRQPHGVHGRAGTHTGKAQGKLASGHARALDARAASVRLDSRACERSCAQLLSAPAQLLGSWD